MNKGRQLSGLAGFKIYEELEELGRLAKAFTELGSLEFLRLANRLFFQALL